MPIPALERGSCAFHVMLTGAELVWWYVVEGMRVPRSMLESFLGLFLFGFFFAVILFCVGSWLSGSRATLTFSFILDLCHLQILQALPKRVVHLEAGFSIMPLKVPAVASLAQGRASG